MTIEQKFLLLAIPILLTGCQATHLLYAHETTLGVDVGVSPDETSGQLVIGYDRDTFALVPRKDNDVDSDAMALASVSCIDVEGLNQFRFNQFIATGSAAIKIAKDDKAMDQIRKALFGGGSKQCQE